MIRNKARTNGHTRPPTAGIDDLTGVWNRAGFVAAAAPVFESCQRRAAPVALAYFDFYGRDTLAEIDNDATVGRILMAMGELLRRAFRASDVVGRLDTLRFAVLLPDCTDEALAAVDGARALTDATNGAVALASGMVRSVPGGTLDDLMREADLRTAPDQARSAAAPELDDTTLPAAAAGAFRRPHSPSRAAVGADRRCGPTRAPSSPRSSVKLTTTTWRSPRRQAHTPSGAGSGAYAPDRKVGRVLAQRDEVAGESEHRDRVVTLSLDVAVGVADRAATVGHRRR